MSFDALKIPGPVAPENFISIQSGGDQAIKWRHMLESAIVDYKRLDVENGEGDIAHELQSFQSHPMGQFTGSAVSVHASAAEMSDKMANNRSGDRDIYDGNVDRNTNGKYHQEDLSRVKKTEYFCSGYRQVPANVSLKQQNTSVQSIEKMVYPALENFTSWKLDKIGAEYVLSFAGVVEDEGQFLQKLTVLINAITELGINVSRVIRNGKTQYLTRSPNSQPQVNAPEIANEPAEFRVDTKI